MNLEKLINNDNILDKTGTLDIDIDNIVYDSRLANDKSVFVAIKGFKVDGHKFIGDVIKKGVKAIVVEENIEREDITVIRVKNTRNTLAEMSDNFYNHPSSKLNLIGVTGTNAKTTTTYLAQSIFEGVGRTTGVVGTIGNIIDGKLYKTDNTTPQSLELQETFDKMLKSKVDVCLMEVSSHALDLDRVSFSDFEVGVFTNLSVEHLDFHKNLENYFEAKLKLFFMSKKYNIINVDDEYGRKIIEKIKHIDTPLLTYGIEKKADIYASDIIYHLDGVDFKLNTPKGKINIKMNIPGEFSVYNGLTAASMAYVYDISLEDIKKGLELIEGVKGRFEVVTTDEDFVVIIDFAHTPDALEKVLESVKDFARGRIVVVFGAGGDRDNSKRAPMGEAVGKHADLSIVTSDNPRTEDPKKIIEDVLVGTKSVTDKYIAITDRKEAIRYAIENKKSGDIILLAGKGHETYTIIGEEKFDFDERKIVNEILEDIKTRG